MPLKPVDSAIRMVVGPLVDDALFYAAACMYKQGRFLEAQATAELMADIRPRSKRTHDMLSRAAHELMAARGQEPDVQVTRLYHEAALQLSRSLLKLAPKHRGAAVAAYRLAEAKWAEASQVKAARDALRDKPASGDPRPPHVT